VADIYRMLADARRENKKPRDCTCPGPDCIGGSGDRSSTEQDLQILILVETCPVASAALKRLLARRIARRVNHIE